MSGFFAALDGVQAVAASALVAGLWQGVVLSVTAGLLLRVMPRSTASLRFVVWAAVFCASVALPFVNLPGSGAAGVTAGSHLVFDMRWSYVLAGLWVVASGYRLVELVWQGLALRALWKSALPVERERLLELEVPLVVRGRSVELCTSDEVDRPSVIGFFAPRILVPAWLLEQLSAVELNHIVLHEMEHLRRRDDWMNLLQKIGLVVFPLSPALFWIDRKLSTERELACDDGVLERTKMPRAYAASLASVAELRLDARVGRRASGLALAATGLRRRRSELGQRIESILGLRAPVNRVFVGGMAAVLVAGVLGSVAALARMPQLVSFGRSDTAQQAAVVPASTAPRTVVTRGTASVRPSEYQQVGFHEPVKARVAKAKTATVKRTPTAKARQVAEDSIADGEFVAPARHQPFVVLTSWEDSPVTQVLVQTPDGRFFLAPYAAVPTQAGWLLVQL